MKESFKQIKHRLFFTKYLNRMDYLGIGGLSGGNLLTILDNGDSYINSMMDSIRSAQQSINLEIYIFNSDEVGWEIANILCEKAKLGVEVNVIYDAVGCIKTSPKLFQSMRDSGVEVLEYHPVIPWRRYWNITFRDHRKILVVDGEIAFLGGMNIGNEYAGSKYDGENWRDTHVKVQGPAVQDIQLFFIENWYRYGGELIAHDKHIKKPSEKGKSLVMSLCSRSRKKIRPIRQSYLSAIRFAKQYIYITNAYFIPDRKIYRALMKAVKRGVDVRLMLPSESDVPIVKYASCYLYKKYLKNKIRIFEYKKNILHAKTAVIDGIWSTIGSSNLDRRSFKKNLEINIVTLDQDFGVEMVNMFNRDLENCIEITLNDWEKRSLMDYLFEWVSYRFRNYL